MFCNKCGKEIPEDSTFCKYCGAELKYDIKENENNKLKQNDAKNNHDKQNTRNNILMIVIIAVSVLVAVLLGLFIFTQVMRISRQRAFDRLREQRQSEEAIATLDTGTNEITKESVEETSENIDASETLQAAVEQTTTAIPTTAPTTVAPITAAPTTVARTVAPTTQGYVPAATSIPNIQFNNAEVGNAPFSYEGHINETTYRRQETVRDTTTKETTIKETTINRTTTAEKNVEQLGPGANINNGPTSSTQIVAPGATTYYDNNSKDETETKSASNESLYIESTSKYDESYDGETEDDDDEVYSCDVTYIVPFVNGKDEVEVDIVNSCIDDAMMTLEEMIEERLYNYTKMPKSFKFTKAEVSSLTSSKFTIKLTATLTPRSGSSSTQIYTFTYDRNNEEMTVKKS